jgi:hypothetical protein
VVGPLGNDFDLRRREVGISVHRHSLKGNHSADRDEYGQHQDQKLLPERRLYDSVDHSETVTSLSVLDETPAFSTQHSANADFG